MKLLSKETLYVICLSLPFYSEVIRKYLYFDNIVYIVSDSILFLVALFIFFRLQHFFLYAYLLLISAYVSWAIIPYLFSEHNPVLISVGIRPLLIPYCCMIIAFALFNTQRTEVADKMMNINAVFWILLAGSVALLQLYLGPNHPINALPNELSKLSGQGIGDYSVNGHVIKGLFRPASIFLHTGKFGQFAFVTSLAVVSRIAGYFRASPVQMFLILFCAIIIFISGQRSSMVLFTFYFLMFFVYNKKINFQFLFFILLASALLIVLVPQEYLLFPLIRTVSGVSDASTRFSGTSSNLSEILSSYSVFGEGIGFFTFGSKQFGGSVLYEYSKIFSASENGWLRIVAESGIIGAAIYLVLMTSIVIRSYKALRELPAPRKWLAFTSFSVSIGFMLWALTHDLFGNYLSMLMLFTFFGASEGSLYRHRLGEINGQQSNNTARTA